MLTHGTEADYKTLHNLIICDKLFYEMDKIIPVRTLISTPAGTTIGLKDSECGHTGAMRIAGTLGCIMEAPAAAAYAVLPVGVEMIRPTRTRTST